MLLNYSAAVFHRLGPLVPRKRIFSATANIYILFKNVPVFVKKGNYTMLCTLPVVLVIVWLGGVSPAVHLFDNQSGPSYLAEAAPVLLCTL